MHNQTIGVIVSPLQARRGGGALPAYAAPYIGEILCHAGLPFDLLPPDALAEAQIAHPLLILAHDLELTPEEQAGAAAYVEDGGRLIGIAGASGLDHLFGCRTDGLLREGYLQAPETAHPVTAGLTREIHVFGGSRVTATSGSVLAKLELLDPDLDQPHTVAAALIAHRAGRGQTLLCAPDLISSVLHIQQGKAIVPPAPRESLGTPQGSVLDPERDGDLVEIAALDDLYYSHAPRGADGRPHYNQRVLLTPMADRLRDLLLRAIFHLCSQANQPLPLLWYWPRGLTSIAHMSHDTDGNRQGLGWSLYQLLRSLEVETTWCTMPVPGYSRDFYETLQRDGYEIALHYATGNAPVREDRRWSQRDFDWQYDALCYAARLSEIVSNKNHGLAWQGRLEFYRWCQARGIQIEQSRGDRGFTFGTCHPWRPMEDDQPGGRFIDVFALCFLTQDLTVVCPLGFMQPLADQCHAAYGVAHFLFHPSHIEDPECERAIRETVTYTRSLGMEWWTSAAISRWERARRRVTMTPIGAANRGMSQGYRVTVPEPLAQATLLFLLSADGPAPSIWCDGQPVSGRLVERYGHRFAQVCADLSGEHQIEVRNL